MPAFFRTRLTVDEATSNSLATDATDLPSSYSRTALAMLSGVTAPG